MSYVVVTGRSVDGTQYASYMGWCPDVREAMLFNPEEGKRWAEILEERESKTREPDNGVYLIKTVEMEPHVYTVEELLELERQEEAILALYEDGGLEA